MYGSYRPRGVALGRDHVEAALVVGAAVDRDARLATRLGLQLPERDVERDALGLEVTDRGGQRGDDLRVGPVVRPRGVQRVARAGTARATARRPRGPPVLAPQHLAARVDVGPTVPGGEHVTRLREVGAAARAAGVDGRLLGQLGAEVAVAEHDPLEGAQREAGRAEAVGAGQALLGLQQPLESRAQRPLRVLRSDDLRVPADPLSGHSAASSCRCSSRPSRCATGAGAPDDDPGTTATRRASGAAAVRAPSRRSTLCPSRTGERDGAAQRCASSALTFGMTVWSA